MHRRKFTRRSYLVNETSQDSNKAHGAVRPQSVWAPG
jgi:hypothetical protein